MLFRKRPRTPTAPAGGGGSAPGLASTSSNAFWCLEPICQAVALGAVASVRVRAGEPPRVPFREGRFPVRTFSVTAVGPGGP